MSPFSGSHATARAIAEQVGVGQATVRRAEKFADAVEVLQQVSPQAAERVLRGEVRDALTELPKVPSEALSFEEGKRVIKEILREWRYQQLEAHPLPKEKFDVIYIVFQSHNGSIVTKPKFRVSGAKQRERCSKRLTVGSEKMVADPVQAFGLLLSPSPHGRVGTPKEE